MQQRKVMPRIEYQRIGDDAVITQRCPDGTTQQIVAPIDQALILADWIVGSAEDHQQAVAPNPHPSPEEDAKTGKADGCTRTAAGGRMRVDGGEVLCSRCAPTGICRELEKLARQAEERMGLRSPVTHIDGEFIRP